MKRGDVVTIAISGDYGKPRPAVVVQSGALLHFDITSILICPLTSDLSKAYSFRVTIEPSPKNGLRVTSQAMVDKIAGIAQDRVGKVIGRLDDSDMEAVDRALAFVLGLAA